MIERNQLENIAKRQKEINQMQYSLDNEFRKYKEELYQRIYDILLWKDKNLGQSNLRYTYRGHIHEVRSNCIVVCLPDTDPELSSHYYNIPLDEIYSDDWKQIALTEREKEIQQALEKEQKSKEIALLEQEQRERAELARLKAKYE